MKIRVCLYVGLLLACTNAFAQKTDQAVAQVKYHFTHLRDTTKKDFPYTEDLVLLLGKNVSVYKSVDKQLQDAALKYQIESQIKSAPDPNHVDLNITGKGAITDAEFYQYANDGKLFIAETVVNFYIAEEPLPSINWKIKKDTLSFGSLHCQLATAHFKGRDYEAWFCPDLPFKNGPWRLWGLPGLILEAHDAKNEVVFKFNGFENIAPNTAVIQLPAEAIKTTRKDLDRLKETIKKDPGAIKVSGSSRRKGGLDMIDPSRIHSINVTKSDRSFSNLVNNPIELPEN